MSEPAVIPFLPAMIEKDAVVAPAAPDTIAASGLERSLLIDLALKNAYTMPQFTTESAAKRLHLPQAMTGDLLEQLRGEQLLEVLGQDGPFGYRYTVSQRGREKASRLLEICGYTGVAPVSLEAYQAMLEWQSERMPPVTPERMQAALAGLVLPDDAIHIAGLAASSGRSLFLSGPPGNGKTSMGRQMHNAFEGDIWIPHAIAVENNVIRLFDPHCHHPVEYTSKWTQPVDQRWVKIKRPFIVAGGEMTLASLDLAYLDSLRYYEAPLHMKANGGTFLIDDFGRQHIEPAELLNRWIIPLEHRYDYMTLHTGQKIQVPFHLMLIIATNLSPKDVTDPAFLRRIGYRLQLNTPTPGLYTRIFKEYAAGCGMTASDDIIKYVMEKYRGIGRDLRSCEPRDLIERVRDICQHRKQPAALSKEMIDLAWRGYFGSGDAV